MKYYIGGFFCFLFKQRFSALDLFYGTMAALALRDYGLLSFEFISMVTVIFCFHFLLTAITRSVRLSHLFIELEKIANKLRK